MNWSYDPSMAASVIDPPGTTKASFLAIIAASSAIDQPGTTKALRILVLEEGGEFSLSKIICCLKFYGCVLGIFKSV